MEAGMTNRERFQTLMAGGRPDRVPFLVFSELLPGSIYSDVLKARGMGLIVHAGSVHMVREPSMVRISYEENRKVEQLLTPAGILTSRYRTDCVGISGSGEIQTEWYVKTEADYEPMIWVLDHTGFRLDDRNYLAAKEMLGDDGVTHTWCDEPPYMGLQYLLGFENWALHQYDCPSHFSALLDAYGRMQDRRMELQLLAPEKDLINIGNLSGNYSPVQYERHVKPYFDKYAKLLREAGCSVTIHADALNLKQHLDLCPGPWVNVMEAFTPPPVGNLSVMEARRAWGDAVTLHINIPESIFHFGYDGVFYWTKDLLFSDPSPNKFLSFTELGLLGVAGSNRDAFIKGIHAVMDAIDEYGSYQAGI
jgi:hypothetical protein